MRLLGAGIIYRLGLHDPAVWPVAAICSVPLALAGIMGVHHLRGIHDVAWDTGKNQPSAGKQGEEQPRDSLGIADDSKMDWLRQLRYSYTEIFPHLNEQMSRPTHFEEAPDKREQFGTNRGMYARHGVPNVDSSVHHSEQ